MPGLQDRADDLHPSPHHRGLGLFASADGRKHVMTAIRTQRRKPLTNRSALAQGTGHPCLKTVFWRFGGSTPDPRHGISLPPSTAAPPLAYTSTVFLSTLPHSLEPELYSTPIVRPPAQFNVFYR
jgi:hypothetical protein